jgi:hypothetical protein
MPQNALMLAGNALGNWQAERDARRQARRGNQALPATPATPSNTNAPATTNNALAGPQAQAFQAFYDTPVYQFPLQQGLEAVNANYAGRGALQSGAAMKAIEQYGQQSAAGGLRDYMSYLGNQSAIGANAAAGQTGVNGNFANSIAGASSNFANSANALGSNYAGNLVGINTNLANAQGQSAQNIGNINSNAAIANANNSNAMVSGIGNALGGFAGSFGYSPYGGGGLY